MSDKRTHAEYADRRELQDAGWRLDKTDKIEFNHGSETVKHVVAKALTAYILRERGYRVDSEVSKDGVGSIDIVGYALEHDKIGVELETSPTEKVVKDKLERYHENEPWREIFVVNISEMPMDMLEAKEYISKQL